MSHILLVKDSHGERELLLIDTVVVGRDPRCEISEPDPQLSRRHAEFAASERGVVVRDLNSRNGMLVNGRRVLEAVLHPGDVVQVAGLAVTFLRTSSEGEEEAAAGASQAERAAGSLPGLPLLERQEDGTSLMSPDQVAAAAMASLRGRRDPVAEQDRVTVDAPPSPEIAAVIAAASARSASPPPPPAPGARPVPPPPPPPPPTPASSTGDTLRTAVAPGTVVPPPRLVVEGPAPITGMAESVWAARVTWQVATLAIVAFLVGAVSVIPWKAAAAAGGAADIALVLLLPLVALLAALGLGLFVAGRVRRATLGGLSSMAAQVRAAAETGRSPVSDPLGTRASSELAEAINEVLERAARP